MAPQKSTNKFINNNLYSEYMLYTYRTARRPVCDLRPVYVSFMAVKIPLGQVSLLILLFSPVIISPPKSHTTVPAIVLNQNTSHFTRLVCSTPEKQARSISHDGVDRHISREVIFLSGRLNWPVWLQSTLRMQAARFSETSILTNNLQDTKATTTIIWITEQKFSDLF
jgi:hypothetical protein